VDYAYTLQGWLKGVNPDTLSTANDIGKDGSTTLSKNQAVARDVVGFGLSYYKGDFIPVGTTNFTTDIGGTSAYATSTPQLYFSFLSKRGE
jgi:hypothetical protein